MLTYRLTGHVSKNGKLQVRLPDGIPPGEVEVVITVPGSAAESTAWTDDEIHRMMQVTPKTGEEIAALLDEMEAGFQHIADSAAWVEEQRHSQKERAQW